MHTQEQEKERLLGYLLNALDDQEAAGVKQELSQQPRLRAELAELQRELAPLNYMDDHVEPPPKLAERTCTRIWKTLDSDENEDEEESPVSQDSVLGTIVDPFKTLLNIPAVSVKSPGSAENKPKITTSTKKHKSASFLPSHWIGLTLSAFVGIAIAFFLFPMIRYAERSTLSYVKNNWMTVINRQVDQYEQIYSNPGGVPQIEAILPFNLALNGWQELHPEVFMAVPFLQPTSIITFEDVIARIQRESSEAQNQNEVPDEIAQKQRFSFSTGYEGWNESIPLDIRGLSDNLLISMPKQENPVRSAFGQAILLKEGRVFFRTIPGIEPPKQ